MDIVRAPGFVCTVSEETNRSADNSLMTERVPSPFELNTSLRTGSNAAPSLRAPIGSVATVAPVSRFKTTRTLLEQLENNLLVVRSIAMPCGVRQVGIVQCAVTLLVF